MCLKLSDIPIGTAARIEKIDVEQEHRERLHSHGVIEHVRIVPLRGAPLGGMRIYRVMNTSVAIRDELAQSIRVRRDG
jgi:Fe2+ transport system protein FeoA